MKRSYTGEGSVAAEGGERGRMKIQREGGVRARGPKAVRFLIEGRKDSSLFH